MIFLLLQWPYNEKISHENKSFSLQASKEEAKVQIIIADLVVH